MRTDLPWRTLATCGAVLIVFFVVCLLTVDQKSPTVDEPAHAMQSYLRRFEGDFRLGPEDPPLWMYWAMLGHDQSELKINAPRIPPANIVDFTRPEWIFYDQVLAGTPGNDGVGFLNHSRRNMALIGVGLGALVAAWAWKLAGKLAAVVAVVGYCFDPNFLGHSTLLKNDVSISLCWCALAMAVAWVGKRASWWSVLVAGLVLGAGLSTKFSGVMLVPVTVLLLCVRILLRGEWEVLRWRLASWWSKLIAAAGVTVAMLGISWVMIWSMYLFRFAPSPQPGDLLDSNALAHESARNAYFAAHGEWPATPEAAPIPLFTRTLLSMERGHVLPQAWLYGLVSTYRFSEKRSCFLLGEIRETGWWYYFPLAMLFKTPLATLVAFGCAVVMLVPALRRAGGGAQGNEAPGSGARRIDPWQLCCLMIPGGVYLLCAMASNLNLGIRHVLPVYPFLYILIGIAATQWAAICWVHFRRVAIVLAIGLVAETAWSYPHYLSFFNAAVGGARGGIRLLSDSNLDWGQDLPALADWQKSHPNIQLYYCCFSFYDPAAYGIEYTNMPGGFLLNPQSEWPNSPGVIAISASRMQGLYCTPRVHEIYKQLTHGEPREVLGGSIYLYNFRQPQM